MFDTQPDIRHDRPDYFGPGRDVACADMVGMGNESASGADELRLRAAVRLVDVAALGARPTRVARVHGGKSDAREDGLVAEERAQLEERPGVQRRALGLANRYPVTDAAEVFNGNTASGVFGFAYDRLADPVIRVSVESSLPPSERAQVTFGGLGAAGLKAGTKPGDARAVREGRLARVDFAVGVDREVADAEVDAEPAFRIDGRAVGHIDSHEEEELALAVDEVGLPPGAIQSSAMVGADGARHDDAAVQSEQAHAVEAVLERVDPLVVGDGAERLERAALGLVTAIDLADLGDRAHGVLCGESEAVPQLAIVGALQGDLVGASGLEGALGEPRAGFVHAAHRREQTVPLLRRDEQLHGRDELHTHRRSTAMTTHKETALPPRPEGRGFRAEER